MATLKRKGSEGFEFVQMVGNDIVERFDSHLSDYEQHLNNAMPHKFEDSGTAYKWGLSVENGILMFNYEEVI